jgi:hypothetical protein
MRGVFRSQTERARLVSECRASGLSAKVFAGQRGIPASTVYQWLAADAREHSAMRIARVIRPPSVGKGETAKTMASPVVVELGAACIRLSSGFDPDVLTTVLDVLETRSGREPS